MAQKDLPFISTVVLLRDTHGTNKEIQQGELTRIGYAKELTNIESVSHTIAKQDGQPSGAVYKLSGDFSSNLPSKSAEMMYCITPVSISIKFDPKLEAAFSDVMTRSSLLNFEEQKGCVVITGPIESVMIFLNDLDQQGAKLLLTNKSNVATATSEYLSSEPEAIPALSTSQYGHNVYDNMSPDALALLEKLPIGSIKGVHYDPSAGRVLIDKETPQLEEERISKFQTAYQSITGKKLKIIAVPVPSGASPDAVATLVHQYNVTYDQCVFTQQGGVIKIISVSSRQIDQANVLLSGDIKKAMSSAKQANKNFEVIHLSTDRTLTLKKADLVKEEVDIIVNPANERLSHAGGIAAALNRASNGQLQKYSDKHVQKKGVVRVGTIAITAGGGILKCNKVIHAVGPDKSYGEANCEQLLNQVAEEVLKGAERYNASSISFPAISTGIFGVKKELVAKCVVDTIMVYNFTKPSPVLSDIRIVIIDEKTYAPFAHYFQQIQESKKTAKGGHRPLIQARKLQLKAEKSLPSPPTSPPPLESSLDKTAGKDTPLEASLSSVNKTPDREFSPKDIRSIQLLLGKLAGNWRLLGIALGFQKESLDQMSAIPAESDVLLTRLLNKWLAGDADSATVSVLVNALGGIDGTEEIVQNIVTVYGTPASQKSPFEGDDFNKIVYPPNLSEASTSVASDGVSITTSTTITTSAQLADQLAQATTDESTPAPVPTIAKNGDVAMNQLTIISAPGTTGVHPPTTCVALAGVVTATPTPSTLMTYSSPPATVSTPPPPGLPAMSQDPFLFTPGGYNSGIPWRYPQQNEHGGVQQPHSPIGGQMSNPSIQYMYPQSDGSYGVNYPNAAQGALQQTGMMNQNNQGGLGESGQQLFGGTESQACSLQHLVTSTSGSMPNYQAPSGSYNTCTTQQGQWVDFSSTGSASSGFDQSGGTGFVSQAVPGAHQGTSFDTVTTQPQSQSQSHHQIGLPDQSVASGTHKNSNPKKEECPICLSGLTNPKKTSCGHFFCKACLDRALQYNPYCPTCKNPLRDIIGNQPVGGTMTVRRYSYQHLPGYQNCGTIEIHYHIPSGYQTQEHPNPGERYAGASRTAYLPDNHEGREVLQLLRRAFDTRLIFTVGTSVTSGQNDVVTWNDIHHKTNTHGGQQNYGYPDPTYLQRVKADLKAKGIVASKRSVV